MDAPPGEAKRRRPHSFRSLRRAPLSDRGASFCEVCIKSTECAGLALTPGLPSSNKPAASPRKLGEAPRMQTLGIRGSSNGRTADSGSAYRGSNPCPRTKSFRPHRLAVRTSASHAGNTSSSLVGVASSSLASQGPVGRSTCQRGRAVVRGSREASGNSKRATAKRAAAKSRRQVRFTAPNRRRSRAGSRVNKTRPPGLGRPCTRRK